MSTEAVAIVSWGILGIFGLLLAVSRLKFEKKTDWRISLGIPFVIVSLFGLITTAPKYGEGFSIMGTLILAGVALMAIKQSETQIRDDRRERKLITIITWANDIAKCETAVPVAAVPAGEIMRTATEIGKSSKVEIAKRAVELILEFHDRNIKVNLGMRYQGLGSMGDQIVLISKGLDKQLGSKLECLAQITVDKLLKHIDIGLKLMEEEITEEEYKAHWKSLFDMAEALAKEATERMG